MSFEYVLEFDCPLKQSMGSESLISLRKTANAAQSILAIVARDQPEADPSQINVGEGTLADMLPAVTMMGQLEGRCQDCPANIPAATLDEPATIGCYGSIAYPFSKWADTLLDWIMRYLVDNFGKGAAGYPTAFMEALRDSPKGGKSVAKMRSQGDTFFENQQTQRYELTVQKKKAGFSLDRIWEALLEPAGGAEAFLEVYLPFFDTIERMVPQAPPQVKSGFESDNTVYQLRVFGNALRLAAQEGVTISTSL